MPKSRITIVGLGLIGTSIGLALKKSLADVEIVGHDKNGEAARRAAKRGAVDKTDWNLIGACDQAGLIILALPLDGVKQALEALTNNVDPGVIISDTATSKVQVLEWARALPDNVAFVGGNPIVKPTRAPDNNPDAASADLFAESPYCLVPALNAPRQALELMTNFVALLGASPYFIDPVEHDGLMAGIQHLPVLTATALLRTVAASSSWQELAKLAGHDFYHATTPADREPETVREVFSAQPADMVRWIDALVSTLQEWRGMVEKGAGDEMESAQAAAVQARADWLSGRAFQPIQPVDMSSVRLNLARMFIGGLADRGPKRK